MLDTKVKYFMKVFMFHEITLKLYFMKCSERKISHPLPLKSLQKQPYADVLQDRCSSKFCNIYRKTSVLSHFLIKLQALRALPPATLFKKDFNTGVFPWIFL